MIERIEDIELHFILCKERTGSTLLVAMLNDYPQILGVGEETFSLYFIPKYGSIKHWTDKLIRSFYTDFMVLHKQSLSLQFSNYESALNELLSVKNRNFDYETMCKYFLSCFHPNKNKNKVEVIIDKQIEYLFFIEKIKKFLPNAKIIFLVRDPRSNIEACIRRNIGRSKNLGYQSQWWNDYYSNVLEYASNPNFIVVKYEDLVQQTERTLQNIFIFLGFQDITPIKNQKSTITLIQNEGVQAKFDNFHSSMKEKISNKYMNKYKEIFTSKQILEIEQYTYLIASRLGYKFEKPKQKRINIVNRIGMLRGTIDRKWILKLYYILPIRVKKILRRISPLKNID